MDAGRQALMRAFISERVREGTNPLPRGACEAEFAYRMARRIRTGLDEVISEAMVYPNEIRIADSAAIVEEPVVEVLQLGGAVATPRRVARALQAGERLEAGEGRQEKISGEEYGTLRVSAPLGGRPLGT